MRLLLILTLFILQSCGPLAPIFAEWNGKARQIKLNHEGKAKLLEAKNERQVQIEDAKGELEASKLKALSEIERAKGVAEANKIIGNSLKGNESYLRYIWIQTLNNDSNDVIYIPTEANLPILEANKIERRK